MVISQIELFSLLKTKLGEQEAKALVTFIEAEVEHKIEGKKDILSTKEDIARLEVKIAETKVDIVKWVVATAISLGGLIIATAKFIH